MQTDAYNPDDLWRDDSDAQSTSDLSETADAAHRLQVGGLETEDLSGVRDQLSEDRGAEQRTTGDAHHADKPEKADGSDEGSPEDEAQRAARAALQRWKSSGSE